MTRQDALESLNDDILPSDFRVWYITPIHVERLLQISYQPAQKTDHVDDLISALEELMCKVANQYAFLEHTDRDKISHQEPGFKVLQQANAFLAGCFKLWSQLKLDKRTQVWKWMRINLPIMHNTRIWHTLKRYQKEPFFSTLLDHI